MSIARLTVVALLCVTANVAHGASVLAQAGGTIWGTSDGEQDMGTGNAPVAAVGAYTRPPQVNDGHFTASAFADAGRFGAACELSVTNAPGYLSPQHSLYGASNVSGSASFQDRWTFSGRPLDTIGRLRLTLIFDGSASGSATGAVAEAFGRMNLDILSLAEFDGVHASQDYRSGELQAADELAVLELEFLYGRPVLVSGQLLARVQISSELNVYSYSGGGTANFDQTAELVALEVQNEQGQWTTDYTLATESGAQYPFLVPEPASAQIALAALAALSQLARRRA